jgi:uncharacterized protein
MSLQEKGLATGSNFLEGVIVYNKPLLKETIIDGISYVCPTWELMGKFNFDLTRQIIESGQSFDRIIALARGGWTWARDLVDGLKIPELSSVRIKSYTGVNKFDEPIIVQPLTDSIHGEKILLFDEVIDSGVTLLKAVEYIRVMGASDIHTAALCYKPHSEIKPDFYAFSTAAWVVFPHEIREFIEESVKNWRLKGISGTDIKSRLTTIGISPVQAEFYYSLSEA